MLIKSDKILPHQLSLEEWMHVMKEDVVMLLSSQNILMRAMKDIQDLLKRMADDTRKKYLLTSKEITFSMKKTEFFLVFANSLPSLMLSSLHDSMVLELEMMAEEFKAVQQGASFQPVVKGTSDSSAPPSELSGTSPLIQEV